MVGAAHFCGGGGNKDPKTAAQNIAAQLEGKYRDIAKRFWQASTAASAHK